MIKANGVALHWERYDFATRDSEGKLWVWPDYDQAKAAADAEPCSELLMRATYATAWQSCV
jgi:hypothetical protein